MVMGGNERNLAARLTLKDELTPKLKGAERSITSFRTELRRVSIQLGLMGAAGSIALRSWIGASEDARGHLNLVSSTLTTAGRNAEVITPKLKDMFTALSGESGIKVGDIAKIWLDLADGLGNTEYATQLTKAGAALTVITGNPEAAKTLAGALTGDAGMVESFKKMSGIDLTMFNTEAERFKAVIDGLEPRVSENVTPIQDLSVSLANLKIALGEGAQQAFGPTLQGLAGFLDALAANEEFTTFAGTFTGLATAMALFGSTVAGLAWLTSSHPLIAAIVALGAALAGAYAAGRALGTWLEGGGLGGIFGDKKEDPGKDGQWINGRPPPAATPKVNMHDVGHAAVGLLEQGNRWADEDGGLWLEYARSQLKDRFPGLTDADLDALWEWQQLVKLAMEKRNRVIMGDGRIGGGGTGGSVIGGPGSTDRGGSVTIINSQGDLDWERRVREINEREGQIGNR